MAAALPLDQLMDRHGLWNEPREDLEAYALDAIAAVLDGRGVKVNHKVKVNRMDGRGPYYLEAGDTLNVVHVEGRGTIRMWTISNPDKDTVIITQQHRIAELLERVTTLETQLKES